MSSFAQKVLNVQNRNGEISIFSLGQAGYIIKTANNKLIGLDMYLTDCVERLCNFRRINAKILAPDELIFDYVIVSHNHPDHYDVDAMPILMSNPYTKLATSICGGEQAKSQGIVNNVTVMEEGKDYDMGDFKIRAVFADHGDLAPYALGLILEIDGYKIYFAGDTAYRPEKVEHFKDEHFDVMIAPINGAFGNLNGEQCALYSKLLQPKLTIPCHFWTFVEHETAGGGPSDFKAAMEKICPENKYLMLTQGSYFKLTK